MTPDKHTTTVPSGVRRGAARAAAITVLTLTAAGATAIGAHAATSPQPRDANGNLSNSVTSTSTGANCVTGTEAGCFTVLATPLMNPGAAGAGIVALGGLGVIALRRRHTEQG